MILLLVYIIQTQQHFFVSVQSNYLFYVDIVSQFLSKFDVATLRCGSVMYYLCGIFLIPCLVVR